MAEKINNQYDLFTDSEGAYGPKYLGGVRVEQKHLGNLLRNARMMYALPIKPSGGIPPSGYDRELVDESGQTWLLPNEEYFKILIQAKYLLRGASARSVAEWLNKELNSRGIPSKMPHFTLKKIMKERRPLDECLLPLDDRNRLFQAEIGSYLPRKGAFG